MSKLSPQDLAPLICAALNLPPKGVMAVLELLEEGATVPFIARYRKERTGGLDEVQIRDVQEKAVYIVELEKRRETVIESIEGQGKLTPELKDKILACDNKQTLEDLYLPYKPKRKTKANIARKRGLEPLANLILEQGLEGDLIEEALKYVDPEKEVVDAGVAIDGARDIVVEAVTLNTENRVRVRDVMRKQGEVKAKAVADKKGIRTKFEDYYDYNEAVEKIPSHRMLAIRRGEKDGVLKVGVALDEPAVESLACEIDRTMNLNPSSPFADELKSCVRDALSRRILIGVETDVRVELKTRADHDAVEVFADNLQNLLLAAPLGQKSVIGIDPGLRTGCKCVALDATGKLLEHITIFPARGQAEEAKAKVDLLKFVEKHDSAAIAVGNGTGGREVEKLARAVLKAADKSKVIVVQVNESGASIYSASDIAREEFPDLDLTIRGAISIGRRLQDPLAELVKLDPKSIGVGQYQHDVQQTLLQRKLGDVVESCVNRVGVELNTASAPLLSYVAGIGPKLAQSIVQHREQNGAFGSRKDLQSVPGLGGKTFEQAAGFLRVRQSDNPLDRSAVHPERYDLVAKMAKDMSVPLAELVGNTDLAKRISIETYVSKDVGEPTLRDIVSELQKPGRDPRREFTPPKFREDVNEMSDLTVGMKLEGVVTNVTNFGAFIDIGVHQDGLAHVSQLADKFVSDPKEVVKVGDKIQVRVTEVDLERKRISLSARSDAAPKAPGPKADQAQRAGNRGDRPKGKNGGKNPRHNKGGNKGDSGPKRQHREQFSNNPFAKLLTR